MKNSMEVLLKLRHNIDLEGDVTLAEMEIESLIQGDARPVKDFSDLTIASDCASQLNGPGRPDEFVRDSGVLGYVATVTGEELAALIERSSFVQNIYFTLPVGSDEQSFLNSLRDRVGPVVHDVQGPESVVVNAVPHYALIELSDPVARRANHRRGVRRKLNALLEALLGRSGDDLLRLTEKAIAAKNTTSHLTHDIHYYKAKFFPRLARAALNVSAARHGRGSQRVVDNFVGSGTTLVEASLLGMPSVGIDIDPLSVLISRTKIEVLSRSPDLVANQADSVLGILDSLDSGQASLFSDNGVSQSDYAMSFPSWLMKNSNMNEEKAEELIHQINIVRRSLDQAGLGDDPMLRTIMSDAIDRKIKLRFLGTGVGRFSLRFTKASIPTRFSRSLRKYVRVSEAIDWLKDTLGITFADAEVFHDDTRDLRGDYGKFDVLLTSPPYLPAASGRESYSKARAASLIALGMEDAESVNDLIDGAVGAMGDSDIDQDSLTEDQRDLVEWLENDELRQIKAAPTARYFQDMRKTFNEMRGLVKGGGTAIMVSGKQSTFYEFESREKLYVVESAELLSDEAKMSGFEVEKLQDVKLQKSNSNARPRSLDDYYETLIYLKNPQPTGLRAETEEGKYASA